MRHINRHQFIQSGLMASFLWLASFASPLVYGAARSNNEFPQYMFDRCQDPKFVTPTDLDDPRQLEQANRNAQLCQELFPGTTGSFVSKPNIVVFSGIGEGVTGGTVSGIKGRTGQLSIGGGGTVSAGVDDGQFGFLVTTLSGETERKETELTSAFNSDLSGFIAGLDYSFSEGFLMGLVLGSVEDEAQLSNVGGGLESESTSYTLYSTWNIGSGFSLDVYYGIGDSEYQSERTTIFGLDADDDSTQAVEGLITGSYDGSQDMTGLSINYDWTPGDWSLGVFAALDSINTELDSYNETGRRDEDQGEPTGFELSIPAQETKSATTSIGLRVGYTASFDWGTLIPTMKFISVSENESDARQINVYLASDFDPQPFTVATDAPDRDYTTGGFSLVGAFNQGSQIFLDYEQRSGHEFIETSSFTLGAVIPF